MVLAEASLVCSPCRAFDLNGVWATDAALCDKMFEKRGSSYGFTEMSDLYGSGLIIEGTRIRGKMAQCTIKSKTEDSDSVRFLAACATSVAPENLQVTLKILGSDSFSRLFPNMQGMEVAYHRCASN